MKSSGPAPWRKPGPARSGRTKLTPESVAWARARARRAGRRYPNLVDNMAAAARQGASGARREADHP